MIKGRSSDISSAGARALLAAVLLSSAGGNGCALAACPTDLDLYRLPEEQQAPHRASRFDIAVEIFERFRRDNPGLRPSQVTVGIVEMRYARHEQLGVRYLDFAGQNRTNPTCEPMLPRDTVIKDAHRQELVNMCRHGINVTSVIAARNDRPTVNRRMTSGYLEPVVGDRARVLLKRVDFPDERAGRESWLGRFREIKDAVDAVVGAGAQIVNLSLKIDFPPDAAGDSQVAAIEWRQFLARHPKVLFVVASPRPDALGSGDNMFPPLEDAPNQLMVGAYRPTEAGPAPTDPSLRIAGALDADVYALGYGIPVVDGDEVGVATGSSFATPIVTSLAAMIQSLQPMPPRS